MIEVMANITSTTNTPVTSTCVPCIGKRPRHSISDEDVAAIIVGLVTLAIITFLLGAMTIAIHHNRRCREVGCRRYYGERVKIDKVEVIDGVSLKNIADACSTSKNAEQT
ncbi:hypothetical protein ONS96_008396 [Cadophora gregata f. sp. sojae]|nr:hypothetical protein ONS96_008396 [Cadophora gregata f. sp. sojae]